MSENIQAEVRDAILSHLDGAEMEIERDGETVLIETWLHVDSQGRRTLVARDADTGELLTDWII